MPLQRLEQEIHSEVHEVEQENVGVEAGHKGEELAERGLQLGEHGVRRAIEHQRQKPWRDMENAQRAFDQANAKFTYQKAVQENPDIAGSNPVSRYLQKKRIQRRYIQQTRQARRTAESTQKGFGGIKSYLQEFIQKAKQSKPVRRLWISSMEDNAIREGFSDLCPGADYEALYQSALCRQKADWLVGINATRLFSVLYHRTLNVGRVLTPTLAMLVERERKISHFKKEKYYVLRLEMNGTEAVSEKLNDSTEVERAAAACKGAAAICTSVTREQKKEQPPKLYDLTTLQREANRLLGYTAKQTLDYAQSLYEKKLLTYPRTDSRYLTSDMAETASCVIHLAAKLPPFDSCSNFFPLVEAMISDKNVSDHHAIIPTMEIKKADIKALPLGERNLFLLVCCKLLCASAEPYVYEAVTATFSCDGQSFTAKGKRILSEGWRDIILSIGKYPLPFLVPVILSVHIPLGACSKPVSLDAPVTHHGVSY